MPEMKSDLLASSFDESVLIQESAAECFPVDMNEIHE
jgi:hypothetical protein